MNCERCNGYPANQVLLLDLVRGRLCISCSHDLDRLEWVMGYMVQLAHAKDRLQVLLDRAGRGRATLEAVAEARDVLEDVSREARALCLEFIELKSDVRALEDENGATD